MTWVHPSDSFWTLYAERDHTKRVSMDTRDRLLALVPVMAEKHGPMVLRNNQYGWEEKVAVYDVFPASLAAFSDGERTKRFTSESSVLSFCRSAEPEFGPLYVKQVGGELMRFENGHLRVGTYEAVAGAVASHLGGRS